MLIPKGWKIIKDVPQSKSKEFEFISCLNENENCIFSWEELQKWAVNLNANLGLKDAEFLEEHQSLISEKMRNKWIVFPGTILRDSDGFLYVACLDWDGDRWVLRFDWIGRVFGADYVLPRSKSSLGTGNLDSSEPNLFDYHFCINCGEKLNHECKRKK